MFVSDTGRLCTLNFLPAHSPPLVYRSPLRDFYSTAMYFVPVVASLYDTRTFVDSMGRHQESPVSVGAVLRHTLPAAKLLLLEIPGERRASKLHEHTRFTLMGTGHLEGRAVMVMSGFCAQMQTMFMHTPCRYWQQIVDYFLRQISCSPPLAYLLQTMRLSFHTEVGSVNLVLGVDGYHAEIYGCLFGSTNESRPFSYCRTTPAGVSTRYDAVGTVVETYNRRASRARHDTDDNMGIYV